MVLAGPFALIAYRATIYLRDTLQVLEDPRKPIELRYRAKNGDVLTLRAERYVIALRQGFIRLDHPRLIDADGTEAISLDYIEGRDIDLRNLTDQVIHVRAEGLNAKLTRLKSGTFDLTELLPEQKGPPSKIPFEVTLQNAEVAFLDLVGKEPWSRSMSTDEVRVTGVGDDWMATTRVIVPGVGTFPVQVERIAGLGIRGETRADGAELAPVWAHLSQTPPFAGTDSGRLVLRSLKTTGPVRLFLSDAAISGTGAPSLEAHLTAQVRDVRYGQYAADSARFSGVASVGGAFGTIDALIGPNHLTFEGSSTWDKGFQASGHATAQSPQASALPRWVRTLLPKGADYRGARFDGWVAMQSPTRVQASGHLVAQRVNVQGETLENIDGSVRYNPDSVVADVRRAIYQGKLTSGVVALRTKDKSVGGTIEAKHVDLAVLGRRFGVKGLTGTGNLVASIGGTMDKPIVDLASQGSAKYQQDGRAISGHYDISGSYANDSVRLHRALLEGGFGLISASGAIGRSGDLGIKIIGRDLNPSLIDSSITGQANLFARVTGSASNPQATGYLEAYNLAAKNYEIPATSARFQVNKRQAHVENIQATSGTAELSGKAWYRFADARIGGQLGVRGVELADFLGENFAGLIDIPNAKIGGTASHPTLDADVSGRNVLLQDLKVDAIGGHLSSDGKTARLEDATAQVAGGTVTGTARFNIERKQGTAQVTATGIALADIVPKLSNSVAVAGRVGGTAQVAFGTKGITSIDGGGRLRDVAVNGTPLGNGPWQVGFNGSKYTGSVQVGSLDQYVSLDDVTFDPTTKVATGQANLFNTEVQDLVAVASRYLPSLSPDALQALHTTTGKVKAGAKFQGTTEHPAVDLTSFEASDLKFQDVSLGTLTADVSMADSLWRVRKLDLSGGAVTANASGTVDEKGNADLNGDISAPSLADLGRIIPQLAGQTGTAALSFVAQGPTKHPDVRLSLDANGLLKAPNQTDASALRFSLLGEIAGAAGQATLEGEYFYRGFQGHLEASAPFDYQHGIPADGKASGSITVAERTLSSIAEFLPNIDAKKTDGKISGKITATGSPDNLAISGGLNLEAKAISLVVPKPDPSKAPNTIDDGLKNVVASLNLSNDRVSVKGTAESTRGGSVDVDVSTPVDEIRRLVSTLRDAGLAALMDNPVTGSVTLNKLALRQTFPNPSRLDEALGGLIGGAVGAMVDGKVDISGTVGEPHLDGRLAVSNAESTIPTIVGSGGTPSVPFINPTFDLRMTMATPAHVRTTAADLTLTGGGRLTGSLASPSIRSNLLVEKGSITLPAANVRLEQGGTVSFNYQPAPDGAIASFDVDMEGKTAVTAQKYGDVYERYDITLGVRGDLLSDNGLTLSAQSDPPDLSQDRILALLGQVDLLSTVATTGFAQSDTERRLRAALTGFALPALTNSFTNKLAQNMGLEYVNIEYNEFELASLAFGKALGGGFSIQGRRQIGDPPPGFKPLYDIRLVYRPRRVRGVLSRFSFSIGADQDRPFKAAIEYGVRF